MVSGANTNEGSIFVMGVVPPPLPVPLWTYEHILKAALVSGGTNRSQYYGAAMKVYPPHGWLPALSDQRRVASDLLGDFSFYCGTWCAPALTPSHRP